MAREKALVRRTELRSVDVGLPDPSAADERESREKRRAGLVVVADGARVAGFLQLVPRARDGEPAVLAVGEVLEVAAAEVLHCVVARHMLRARGRLDAVWCREH